MSYPQCISCKHGPGPRCLAFPGGIPEEIYFNKISHRKPHSGDHGIQFEDKKKEETNKPQEEEEDKSLQHGGPGSGWYAEEGHVPGSQGGSGPGGGGEEMPKEKESFMEENAAVALSTEMGMTRYNEVKAFSPAHEKALAKYTSSTYQDINGKLRAGSFLGGEKKTVEKMDELLDNAPPLPKGKDIYRGVGSTTGEKMIKNMKVGDICEDKGFQSFSTHPYTAGYFSRRTTSDEEMMATNKDHRVVIKVTTDGKTKGVLIGGAEHEVLLKRGQKLQCVGMEEIVEKPKGYRIKIVTHVYTMKAVD
jgi:hypothetical protein